MTAVNNLSETKLVAQRAAPEQLSPEYLAACHCSTDKDLLKQELEFLWEDSDAEGKTYGIYLGKISRNPIVKSKITGKYFALPWSVIIKLAAEKGIDHHHQDERKKNEEPVIDAEVVDENQPV